MGLFLMDTADVLFVLAGCGISGSKWGASRPEREPGMAMGLLRLTERTGVPFEGEARVDSGPRWSFLFAPAGVFPQGSFRLVFSHALRDRKRWETVGVLLHRPLFSRRRTDGEGARPENTRPILLSVFGASRF